MIKKTNESVFSNDLSHTDDSDEPLDTDSLLNPPVTDDYSKYTTGEIFRYLYVFSIACDQPVNGNYYMLENQLSGLQKRAGLQKMKMVSKNRRQTTVRND